MSQQRPPLAERIKQGLRDGISAARGERDGAFDTFQMSTAHLQQIREDTVADAPASIREVAAHAGVSVGTVSNVLNRPDIVRPIEELSAKLLSVLFCEREIKVDRSKVQIPQCSHRRRTEVFSHDA